MNVVHHRMARQLLWRHKIDRETNRPLIDADFGQIFFFHEMLENEEHIYGIIFPTPCLFKFVGMACKYDS